MELHRGEIYYIEKSQQTEEGSEQRTGRPAIIVSNEKCNMFSNVIEVVYLTTQPKTDLPTHIDIRSAQKPSTALCEQINSICVERIGTYIGKCTDYEMMLIDAALEISLGLNTSDSKAKETKKEEKNESPLKSDEVKELEQQIIKLTSERDLLQQMYLGVLERIMVR